MSDLPKTQGKTLPDAWDYKGRPAERSKTGGWTAAAMILGGEAMERLTTLGIAVNLVSHNCHLRQRSSNWCHNFDNLNRNPKPPSTQMRCGHSTTLHPRKRETATSSLFGTISHSSWHRWSKIERVRLWFGPI
nr:protein nrt1/ ptr family 6.3 [Quercus suber]